MPDPEHERIRRAYAARDLDDLDDLYDPRRADVISRGAERERAWGRQLLRLDHELGDVVEVGAGSGVVLRWALAAGARSAVAVDVIAERLCAARRAQPRISSVIGDGQQVPLRAGSADTVIASTLFSSILDDAVATRIAAELARVLRPGGIVLWFDLARSNPSNCDVRGVAQGDVAELFGGFEVRLERVVLAPPLARRLVNHPRLAGCLEALGPLRTHLAGALVPRPARRG